MEYLTFAIGQRVTWDRDRDRMKGIVSDDVDEFLRNMNQAAKVYGENFVIRMIDLEPTRSSRITFHPHRLKFEEHDHWFNAIYFKRQTLFVLDAIA